MSKILCILDGFGMAKASANNCVSLAKMPCFKSMLSKYPWLTLDADGGSVGQKEGLVGNSEVGHTNLGGLKLINQISSDISLSAKNNFKLNGSVNTQIIDPIDIISKFKEVNIIGLFGAGTVHSDIAHWKAAINSCKASTIANLKINLHLLTDGRDSDRKSFVKALTSFCLELGVAENVIINIASVGGRFYCMDRDNNQERIGKGLIGVFGLDDNLGNYSNSDIDEQLLNVKVYIENQYNKGIYDENIEPKNFIKIGRDSLIWLINFRGDRMRQLAESLAINSNKKAETMWSGTLMTMVDYGNNFEGRSEIAKKPIVIFKKIKEENNLADYISSKSMTQLHIAETEKYNHVTYFFNGCDTNKRKGEDWVIIPSNKVNSHIEMPAMKAVEITDYIVDNIAKYDYIIVNYANPDMIGHCGDVDAGIKTLEILDKQLRRLENLVLSGDHTLLVTADHGNIEKTGKYLLDGVEYIDTQHNLNPVPLIIVGGEKTNVNNCIAKVFGNDNALLSEKNKDLMPANNSYENMWLQEIPKPSGKLFQAGVLLTII